MESSAQIRLPEVHPNEVRIGTAGWAYKDWGGIFYPSGMQRRKQHPLEYLARFFDTTEINTSFYGPLKQELSVHSEALPCLHPLADVADGADVCSEYPANG